MLSQFTIQHQALPHVVTIIDTPAYYLCNQEKLKMKILHISDTHDCHHRQTNLPEADILIHSDDFTMNGSEQEVIDFLNWLCDLDYPHKIFICVNLDECLYGANIDGLDSNVRYLCNSGIELQGIKFYRIPMFMGDCITERQSRNYAQIPISSDVLITHTPPLGILDFDDNINYGSDELLYRMEVVKPRLHLFGHIHTQHGTKVHKGVTFSNGAVINAEYQFCIPESYRNLVRKDIFGKRWDFHRPVSVNDTFVLYFCAIIQIWHRYETSLQQQRDTI